MLAAGFGDTRFFIVEGNHFPKGTPFYSDAGTDSYNERDAKKAKAPAEQAGYKGEPVRILTSRQYDFHYNMALIMAEQLKRAGFKAELRTGRVGDAATAPQRPTLWDIYITHSAVLSEPMLIARTAGRRRAGLVEARRGTGRGAQALMPKIYRRSAQPMVEAQKPP